MILYEYEFCIKTLDNMNVYMKALGVPEICSALTGQRLDLAKVQHPFLNELNLAETGCSEGNVDLLIGADLY